QSKLTLMSESLRNDGRIWVPKKKEEQRAANDIPEPERDYYLERRYPAFGNLCPRDIARGRPKNGSTLAMEWGRSRTPSISISPGPSANKEKARSWKNTVTFFACTKKLPASAPTPNRCVFHRLPISPWAGCGWTMSS